MKLKRKKNLPLVILATRRANREIEQLLLGIGFHARTKIKRSKKLYSRKKKHQNKTED